MLSNETVDRFIIKSNTVENIGARSFNMEIPAVCPRCNHGSVPTLLASVECTEKIGDITTEIANIYFCPVCENYFFATQYYPNSENNASILELHPNFYKEQTFPDEIKELSPNFVNIYNQAHRAESYNLIDICGAGYRKSLEFLVKDFAISNNPNDKEKIIKLPLAKCIQNYLSENLSSLATAAVWLGNDATHYERKHIDYGINEMKNFINAAISYIDCELQIKKAYEFIQNNN